MLPRFLFIITLTSVFSGTSYAQETNNLSGYITFKSNFESLYVVINEDSNSVYKVSVEELIELDAGEHSVTIIPEFAEPFNTVLRIKPDTVRVVSVYFRSIMHDQNPYYKLLEAQSIDQYLGQKKRFQFLDGMYFLNEYSVDEFHGRKYEQRIDFKNTYLKVSSNVDSLFLQVSRYLGEIYHIANNDSVAIRPGTRRIILGHPSSYDQTFVIDIEEGITNQIEHNFRLTKPSVISFEDNIAVGKYYNSNLIVISDEDSDIYINGRYVGLGAAQTNVRTGPFTITVYNPYMGERTFTGTIANIPGESATIINAYTKPDISMSRSLTPFPGASQLYKRQRLKGFLLSGGFILQSGLTLYANHNYRQELREFNALKERYLVSTNEQTVFDLGNQLEQMQPRINQLNDRRMLMIGLTTLIYAFNIYDALFTRPNSGYRSDLNLNLYLEPGVFRESNYSSFTISYGF
jgi:hypothetical protein